jgi:hypothetical protein
LLVACISQEVDISILSKDQGELSPMLILRVDGVWMDVVRNEVFPMVAQYLDALPTRRKYVLTQRNLLGLKNRDAGILAD